MTFTLIEVILSWQISNDFYTWDIHGNRLLTTLTPTKVYPWWQITKCIFVWIISLAAKIFQSFLAEWFQHLQTTSCTRCCPVNRGNDSIYFQTTSGCFPINMLKNYRTQIVSCKYVSYFSTKICCGYFSSNEIFLFCCKKAPYISAAICNDRKKILYPVSNSSFINLF